MSVQILVGDAITKLRELPDESVHCVVTSPPYWGLRAYKGEPGMIGLEPTFEEHLENLVAVFREVRRVLRKDGTLWLNYGDAYATGTTAKRKPTRADVDVGGWKSRMGDRRSDDTKLKPKDLMMMPARVAMALQADGWWLRSEIVWHKPNPMPESVTDRPTNAHEKVFLLSKSAKYFYDAEAVRTHTEHALYDRPYNQKRQLAPTDKRTQYKTPDEWDTGSGAHGSVHRQGREKGRTPKDLDGR